MRMVARTTSLVAIVIASNADAGELSGDFQLGWRNVSINGSDNKFRQHIDLTNGTRLLGLRLEYQPEESVGRGPDQVRVEMSNLGGDPFQSIDVSVLKRSKYDFRYRHRKSTYFYDDLLIDPDSASIENSIGGDFHRFDVEREHDSVSLGIHVTPQAKATLAFDRYRRNGDSTTTRDVQRDEFELHQTIDEVHDVVSAGLEYHWETVNLSVEHRIRDFDSDNALLLPGFSSGLNDGDPTSLDLFFSEQPYGYDGNETQLRLNSRSASRIKWNLSASALDFNLDSTLVERSQGVGFMGDSFVRNVSSNARVDRQLYKYDFDSSFVLTDRIHLNSGLRYRRLDQEGLLNVEADTGRGDWALETFGVDLGFGFNVSRQLSVAAGWSGERRDANVQVVADANIHSTAVDTDRNGYFARFDYRPIDRLTLRAIVEKNSIDDPLTLASATDITRYRLRARVRISENAKVALAHKIKDHDNDRSAWSFRSEQTDLRLTYDTARLRFNFGAAIINLDRDYERIVSGGFREDLFQARYRADTSFVDGSIEFTATDSTRLGSSIRYYDNDGSFVTNRRDAEFFIEYAFLQDYRLHLSYRNVDYDEDLEDYDADIIQLGLGARW